MEGFIGFCVIAFVIGYQILKAYNAAAEKQKEENLKYTNPEVYVHLKQIEHERQMMAHDEKRMKHQKIQTGAGIFGEIFRSFMR